jgi:hypothetical protein
MFGKANDIDDIGGTMFMQTIQELETERKTSLMKMKDINIEIAKRRANSPESLLLRKLRQAYIDYIGALERNVADETKRIVCYDPLTLRENELREAEIELIASENQLDTLEVGSITHCCDRYRAAETKWWSAIDALTNHRSLCPYCQMSRS